jgi:hypothetical protein
MFRHKVRPGHFEQMNLRRERAGAAVRRKMLQAAMAGRRSGFAIQVHDSSLFSDTAASTIPLRQAHPRAR